MKIINYGKNYEIYEDDLKTFDSLPALTYKVKFNMMSGFSLVAMDDFKVTEEKVYGNHKEKIEKVLKSFEASQRSLGVILSGDKGMGKSMFVQLLAVEAVSNGIPVIIVSKPYGGIAEFLEKIDQEVLVIFDEFEKIFPIESNERESQNSLLSLFDGISQKKRLYAITVNHLHKLSEFMINRAGRFHYHIQFTYPESHEIEEYLTDKIDSKYHNEIKKVIMFATRIKLNYDSLRAIAFEINQGYTFSQAISDLNITSTESQTYDVKIHFSNGETDTSTSERLNLFRESIRMNGYVNGSDYYKVKFNSSDIKTISGEMVVDGKDVNLEVHEDEDEEKTTNSEPLKVLSIEIALHKVKGVNYDLAY